MIPNFGHHFKRAHYPNYKELLTQEQPQIQGVSSSNVALDFIELSFIRLNDPIHLFTRFWPNQLPGRISFKPGQSSFKPFIKGNGCFEIGNKSFDFSIVKNNADGFIA